MRAFFSDRVYSHGWFRVGAGVTDLTAFSASVCRLARQPKFLTVFLFESYICKQRNV